MLLCLHSNRSRASLQLLIMWPRVQGETEQRGHFGSTIFFHLDRLSGLARQLVVDLAAQVNLMDLEILVLLVILLNLMNLVTLLI